jgi:hypothetical protein
MLSIYSRWYDLPAIYGVVYTWISDLTCRGDKSSTVPSSQQGQVLAALSWWIFSELRNREWQNTCTWFPSMRSMEALVSICKHRVFVHQCPLVIDWELEGTLQCVLGTLALSYVLYSHDSQSSSVGREFFSEATTSTFNLISVHYEAVEL